MKKKLKGLKIDKSPGSDGMHPRILKELSDTIASPLCILFNKHFCKNGRMGMSLQFSRKEANQTEPIIDQ